MEFWLPTVPIYQSARLTDARDVGRQLLDIEFLVLDNGPYHVADRDHAHDCFLDHHWQVSDMLVGHEGHRLFNRLFQTSADDRMGHDLADLSLPGRLPLKNHLASVVAFGDDADE